MRGADAVINPRRRSVNCRYNAANRKAIVDSRVLSTRVVGRAIAAADPPPGVWLQASTATIYAHRYDAPNDEATGIIGGAEPHAPDTWKFSIDVVRAWEQAFDEAATPQTRKVLLRSAMTMSPDRGGIFDTVLTLVRTGLGGPAGGGRQYVVDPPRRLRPCRPLAHRSPRFDGIVNVASPNPLPQREFMRILRREAGVPIGLPAARWMLEVGAFFMRTETELILKSRRVVPARLMERGFTFEYPDWPEAARDLREASRKLRRGNVDRILSP